jgi:hypothetical protein
MAPAIMWNAEQACGVNTHMKIHPGIRIDKIPVEGSVGLLWGAVIMIRTLIDVPDARWFFLASLPAGVAVAIGLNLWRNRGR